MSKSVESGRTLEPPASGHGPNVTKTFPEKTRAVFLGTFSAFFADKAMRLAAVIAYSAIFSIAPVFIILITIGGKYISAHFGGQGDRTAEDLLISRVQSVAGQGAADAVRGLVDATVSQQRESALLKTFWWLTLVAGATAFFSSLQDALNTIWYVEATRGGWKHMLRKRAASFGMVGVIGALLLASTTLNVSLALLASKAPAAFSILGDPALLAVTGQLVTLCVVAITFAAVFKVLPDVNVEWRDVWIGAIATAVLFVAGETAISLYFRFSDVASGYGATGSLLVVLLWIYYSAALLLLGAEFTKVHAGKVATTVSATISILDERPAGVDPRAVRAEGRKLP